MTLSSDKMKDTGSTNGFARRSRTRGNSVCRCIDLWAIPPEVYHSTSNADERHQLMRSLAKQTAEGPFAPNSLTTPAPISFLEEAAVVLGLSIQLGGPLVWVFGMLALLMVGTWTQLTTALAVSAVLAYHPMPSREFSMRNVVDSWWSRALYKYFTYRFVWAGDAHEKVRAAKPWIGAGPPHGVLPFANVLSIPGINSVEGIDFVGASASVVMMTPFLRYLTLFPTIAVAGASINKAIDAGVCVGIVPDGIAGIFRQDSHQEVVALKTRKGLARHCLRYGTNILPAYSFGNTACFSAWWDPYGYMERLSRKCQASFFLYWGRFYLPIPRRCQITMVYGDPIIVEKVESGEPTQEQIDELHEKVLAGIRECFEYHKAALGWGDKELVFA